MRGSSTVGEEVGNAVVLRTVLFINRSFSEASLPSPRKKDPARANTCHRVLPLVLLLLATVAFTWHFEQRNGRFNGSYASPWENWTPERREEFQRQLSECSEDSERIAREYFHDIVLIINNNYETHAANTTAFWRDFYSRLFDHIVVISAHGIPELGIGAAASLYPDAPKPWWGNWMYQFWALRRIMQAHPHAAGFLWTNDDVIINYWNVVGANKSQLWLPNNPVKYEFQVFDQDPTPAAANLTFGNWASRLPFRKQLKLALSLMDERYRLQYNESNLPRRNVYHKRGCDLFYIPQRFSHDVVHDVLPALQGGQLVSELAIPLMFYSLDHPNNFSPVLNDMVYVWDHWRTAAREKVLNPRECWTGNISAFHPWKISRASSHKELLESMSPYDGCISEIYGIL